jgi:hypothetical protein
MELLIVYNAHSDAFSAITDYAHKVLSPSTYKCDLCSLTHHNFGERSKWKEFKNSTNAKISFWYIKEFEKKFVQRFDYPVVLERRRNSLKCVVDKERLSKIKDVSTLVQLLNLHVMDNHSSF